VRLKTRDYCIDVQASNPVHLVNISMRGCTFRLRNCSGAYSVRSCRGSYRQMLRVLVSEVGHQHVEHRHVLTSRLPPLPSPLLHPLPPPPPHPA